MDWKIVKELKEKRAAVYAQANELRALARKDNRDLTADEVAKHDAMIADVEKYGAQIDREERALELGSQIDATRALVGREDTGNSIAMPAKDFGRYSLLRAIRLRMNNQPLDGIEAEVSAEIAKRTGKDPQGFYAPLEATRALNTTTGTGGVQAVVDSSLIELLRAKTLVSQLGAVYLPNMVGSFKLPRQTGGATAYWVAESGAPTASNQTLDQVAFAAKTVGAFTDVSRQFINQSSLNAEQFVRNDLASVLAIAIDTAAFQGTGSNNQPTGILNYTGVGSVAIGTNGGAPTRAKILEMEKTLAVANVNGNYQFVTTPAARAKLKAVDRGTDTGKYLWADDNTVEGYRAHASNLVPANLTKGTASGVCSAAVLGDFSELVIAMWGGLDILVDPYTGSSSGTVRVVALQDVDIQLRHAASFVAIQDMTTT